MSKKELESYARKELGIEIDKRENKKRFLARIKQAEKIMEQVHGARDTFLSSEGKGVGVLKPPSAADFPKAKTPKESEVKKHLEELRMQRRDAAIIWDEINDKDLNDEDIRELIRSHNFGTLLGEVSQ